LLQWHQHRHCDLAFSLLQPSAMTSSSFPHTHFNSILLVLIINYYCSNRICTAAIMKQRAGLAGPWFNFGCVKQQRGREKKLKRARTSRVVVGLASYQEQRRALRRNTGPNQIAVISNPSGHRHRPAPPPTPQPSTAHGQEDHRAPHRARRGVKPACHATVCSAGCGRRAWRVLPSARAVGAARLHWRPAVLNLFHEKPNK